VQSLSCEGDQDGASDCLSDIVNIWQDRTNF